MSGDRANPISAPTDASSALELLRRPVTARLLEPLLWGAAVWAALHRRPPDEAFRLLEVAAVFLIARLAVDTGPNLLAATRLESAPYDERSIRRALNRVKSMLALAAALVVLFLSVASDAPAWREIAEFGGGPIGLMLRFAIVLLTYGVATPVLREHRGVPIARPNLGPAAAAAFFLTTQWPRPTVAPLAAAAVSIVAGNLTVGLIQRYREAARRIGSASEHLRDADLRARELVRPREERYLSVNALGVIPFLLTPIAPAVAATFAMRGDVEAILVAAIVAALPPILFDAKRGSLRFTAASLVSATALAALGALAFERDHTLIQTAIVVASYPLASRLLRCGEARLAGLVTSVYLVAKSISTGFPQAFNDWSTELALLLLMAVAAVVAGRARRG